MNKTDRMFYACGATVVVAAVCFVAIPVFTTPNCRTSVPDRRGCSHRDHRFEVVDGAAVCLCDGGTRAETVTAKARKENER